MEKVTLTMQKHFVTFYSPGTFAPEETTKPIDAWDVDEAVKIARDIVERHAARPYAFRFTTRARSDTDLDSKVVKHSGFYYLGGRIETAEEVLARADPKEQILRSNIRGNRIKRIIVNDNSWRHIGALEDDDVIVSTT